MESKDAKSSAIRKLDRFYTELEPDEREFLGLIVSSAVQRAARAQAERDWLHDGEDLLKYLTPEHAPTLIKDLGTYVPGQAAPMRAEKRPLE